MTGEPHHIGTSQARPVARRRLRGHLRAVLSALVVVALVSAAWAIGIQLAQREQDAVNTLLRDEIARLDAQIKEVAQLRKDIDTARSERQVLAAWNAQRQWPAQLLRLLAQTRTPGIQYEQVRDTPGNVRLSGRARSYAEVAALAVALERSPLVRRVDVVAIQHDERDALLKFSLEAEIDKALRPTERGRAAARVGAPTGDPK